MHAKTSYASPNQRRCHVRSCLCLHSSPVTNMCAGSAPPLRLLRTFRKLYCGALLSVTDCACFRKPQCTAASGYTSSNTYIGAPHASPTQTPYELRQLGLTIQSIQIYSLMSLERLSTRLGSPGSNQYWILILEIQIRQCWLLGPIARPHWHQTAAHSTSRWPGDVVLYEDQDHVST